MTEKIIQNPSITTNVFEYDEAGRVSAISGHPLAGEGGGGSVAGDYLPLSGGVVNGAIVVSGNQYYNQFVAIRPKSSSVHSAYFGAGSDGRAFIKSGLAGRPEFSIYTDHILFTNDSSSNPRISAYVPFYNKNEVSNYDAFGFDKNGNTKAVQPSGNYVKFVDPTTQEGELKIQYLRAVQDSTNIPSTSEYPTLWIVVSAVE